MHEVERELLKITKWKPKTEHVDRQDYLAGLTRAVDRLPPDVFDELSNDATDWWHEAADSINHKELIRDFEAPEDVDAPEASPMAPLEDEFAPEGVPVPTPEEVDQAVAKSKPQGKAYKKQVRQKAGRPKGGPSDAPRKPYEPEEATHDYSKVTGEVDRYGVRVGTKVHEAVKLYEKGCTANDLSKALGGRYYNILTKLQKEGHLVEKFEGGMWRLTHKSEVENGKRKGE